MRKTTPTYAPVNRPLAVSFKFPYGVYQMAFNDLFNYSFNYSAASKYVTEYWDKLEFIYNSQEALNGDQGKVWRQFHGKPQYISF